MSTDITTNPIAIIGTGFGGLAMAIALKKAGIEDFLIFEKGQDVGGTWRENSYPGAACDVHSHLYSFSFAPNPLWSHKYSPQPEILAYLRRCADDYGLRRHIQFGVELASAAFDDHHARWTLKTSSGETLLARALVSACGQLNRPAMVRAQGIENFKGIQFHSAQWRHDVDLSGQRVAVIGTGASAIQFLPHLARQAASLKLFQRTPPYIIPRDDRAYRSFEKTLLRIFPPLRWFYRAKTWLTGETLFKALSGNPLLQPLLKKWAFRQLEQQVSDPELRRKLSPDYPIGCKRVLISDDYYPALTRPNVEVICEAVREVTATGVVTADGQQHAVDIIIHGTGFAATDFLAPMQISGRGGLDLNSRWREGAEAYLGVTVSGFPNLFLLYGPNTNLGHNSIVYMIESQVRYVMSCLSHLDSSNAQALDLNPPVQAEYNREMQERLKNSVWASGCHNWYVNASGRNTNNWPGPTWEYRRRTARINPLEYELLRV